MSVCYQDEQLAVIDQDGVEPTARDHNKPLTQSYTSTAQWVVRHADIKDRFEKLRSQFELWSSCSLSATQASKSPERSPSKLYLLRRRASEPIGECLCLPDDNEDSSAVNTVEPNNAAKEDDYLSDSPKADYHDWMDSPQALPETSGRSRPCGLQLLSVYPAVVDDCDCSSEVEASSGVAAPSGFNENAVLVETCVAVSGRSPSPLREETDSDIQEADSIFVFDDTFANSQAERSASFTTNSYRKKPIVTVHRSPSHPGRKPDFSLSEQRKTPGSLQVNRVKKVSSLRSFGAEDSNPGSLCNMASSIDSLVGNDTSNLLVRVDSYESAGHVAVQSPRVHRRPPVPSVLHSPSATQRLLLPDLQAAAHHRLRPALLHPEFRSMLNHLERSPSPELQPSKGEQSSEPMLHSSLLSTSSQKVHAAMAGLRKAALPASPWPLLTLDNAAAYATGIASESLDDEGLDVTACSVKERIALNDKPGMPSALAPMEGEENFANDAPIPAARKKGAKRSRTHPPAGSAQRSESDSGGCKVKDANGFSSLWLDDNDAGGHDTSGGGVASADSLYGSLAGLAETDATTQATEVIPDVAVGHHRLTAVDGKSKRVKSDPFPGSHQASGLVGVSLLSPGTTALDRSPSDVAHNHTLSCGVDALVATVPAGEVASEMLLVSSEDSAASLIANGAAEQRFRIVNEIIEKEEIYVANLEQVSQAVSQLKEQQILDGAAVDKIFCSVRLPESRVHHKIFLESLRFVLRQWDPNSTTVGDRIASMFSSQSVLENYLSYVANCSKAKIRLEQAFKMKPNFCKFNDTFRRGNVSRQDLRAVLTLPANHLISYRFFIERMLKYTSCEHPDYERLQKARLVVLELLDKVGGQDQPDGAEAIKTLKKLEALLAVQDLAVADRVYIRNDSVVVKPNKREHCCIWMFSDILLITVLKGARMSGGNSGGSGAKLNHPRRGSMTIVSPRGQEIVEKQHHKLWLRLGLEDLDIFSSPEAEKRACTKEMVQTENDLERLVKISEETDALVMQHEKLQKSLLELMDTCNQQLAELRLRRDTVDMTTLQLLVHTGDGQTTELTVQFESAEKRSTWEAVLSETRLNLETALTDKMPPEFKDAIPITKTRAGMQFSCATPIEGAGPHDVWVCNSDSYVGHVCLLSLLPQPSVTMSAAVPSCLSRVLCACSVPAAAPDGTKAAGGPGSSTGSPRHKRRISFYEVVDNGDALVEEEATAADSLADSDVSDDDSETKEDDTDLEGGSTIDDLCIQESTNLRKDLVWLGTEDGCILIFSSEENLRTSRVRPVRVQHPASVLCIVFLEQAVFVSLGNGSLAVYRRTGDGGWNLDCAENPSIGGVGVTPLPVTKMLAVGGKLWCSYQNEVVVLDPHSLKAEISFAVSADRLRSVQSMACSRHGVVAIAIQGGCDVKLFHAASRKFLVDVNVAAAVAQKLQACDDIIRQHKMACLKITVLLACKDLLWIGTTAGVLLTLPLPKITPSMATSREFTPTVPSVSGLLIGHTGNVRFLTCTELPHKPNTSAGLTGSPPGGDNAAPPAAQSVVAKLLVVSGGDGYENFDESQTSDTAAGSNDSVNHLLLWEV